MNPTRKALELYSDNHAQLVRAITLSSGNPNILLDAQSVKELLFNLAQNDIEIFANHTPDYTDNAKS